MHAATNEDFCDMDAFEEMSSDSQSSHTMQREFARLFGLDAEERKSLRVALRNLVQD